MTQNDLFEWAEQLYSKYGIKEKQLELPLNEPEKKETKEVKTVVQEWVPIKLPDID